MASLIKKPTSQFWFACFRDRTGKQHRISTHETRKSVAQKIADKFELVATRKTSRRALWNTVNELQTLVGGDQTPNATLSEFFELWLANRKAEGIAEATYAVYSKTSRRFLEFLGSSRSSDSVLNVSKRDIERFRNQLVDDGLAPASINRTLKVLRMMFRTARIDGYIFEEPTEGVRMIKGEPSKRRRPFTLEEIRAVLAIANPEWQSLIKLGLYSGQRLGDLALLRWENVDLIGGRLRLVTRKTGTDIKLPLRGALRDHLLSLPSSDNPKDPLHSKAYELLNAQGGRTSTLSNQFVELLVEAGLRPPQTHERTRQGCSGPRVTSELSFHSLRHSAVTLLKNTGVPHAVAQALVGHESAAISESYTHIGELSLGEAIEKFPVL